MAASSAVSPTNWCTTCSGSARWSRCCEDDAITDIMVNGPRRIFVERGGKVTQVRRAFPRSRRI